MRPGEVVNLMEDCLKRPVDPATGRDICGLNLAEQADDTLLIGRVAGMDGKTRATIVNYACHPVSLGGGNRLLSPDYIGAMREVVERVIAEVGAGRTSIRLSPNGETQGADDSNPEAVFVPAAKVLNDLGIAFLELREQSPDGTFGSTHVPKLSPKIRKVFSRPLVLNQDYTLEKAQADLRLQHAMRVPDPTVSLQYEREQPDKPNTVGIALVRI